MAKKVNITAEQFANRWKTGLQNSSQKIEDGVNAVSENPCELAAAQADLWATNTAKAKDKFRNNLRKVSTQQWKQATIQKGIPALMNSIDMAESKVQTAGAKIIAAVNNGLSNLPPRTATLEGNIQRVVHMAKAMQKAFSQ